ncbi:dihydrodipicolinate synthase family protein [Candidatus Pelagibacter sp.]|jgi:4-hydroxy-tetrahydrodipicolinate synthase|nr:dihydrodipicolinate synthase family protein [Candidatus Pelagibacter sp.]
MTKNFKGIYAATVVPLKKNKSINKIALKNHIKDIIKTNGIKGLLLNGHAGENFTLNIDEQIKVIEIAKKYKNLDKKLISGLNFEDPLLASNVVKKMTKAGADAILIFPPFSWSQGISEKMIFQHHKVICNKINKPVFLYQSSIYSGHLSYKKDLLKKLLKIKNIIGVKEGSWDYKSYVNNYKFLKKIKKDFLVMASGDEHLYPCFKYASDGSQVSLAAITPEKIVELIRLIENKEFSKAKKLDKKLLILAKNIYDKYPPSFATARIKYCLKVLKKIPSDLMRSSISLDANEKIQLKKSLKTLGFKL